MPFVPIPVPSLSTWVANMHPWWVANKTSLDPANPAGLTFDNRLLNTYYDGEWSFYNIADYIPAEVAYWTEAAIWAQNIYRDGYLIPNGGALPGFWVFPRGLYENYIRTLNATSYSALVDLSYYAAYAPDATPLVNPMTGETQSQVYSREVAYNEMSYILTKRLGLPTRTKYVGFYDQMQGHCDQWYVDFTAAYLRPFMWSLTSYSMIEYAMDNPSVLPAVLAKLILGADYIWDTLWLSFYQSWQYTDRVIDPGDTDPAPDLNNLISPIYAWLYYQTGLSRFQERYDAAFVGGIPVYNSGVYASGAYLGSAATAVGVLGKHVNQNSRLIFKGLQWRQATPIPFQTSTSINNLVNLGMSPELAREVISGIVVRNLIDLGMTPAVAESLRTRSGDLPRDIKNLIGLGIQPELARLLAAV